MGDRKRDEGLKGMTEVLRSKRVRIVLAILAVLCGSLLVFIFVQGFRGDIASKARTIWDNTIAAGNAAGRVLRGS